ncbi:MAG: hypothetical protein IT269_07225, partial [Saprospiraceae bacterium]|nr:hypothetical protein [Saprospiraceae bacterium]
MPENTKQQTLFRSFLKEVSFDKTKTWLTENIFFFFWIFLVPLIMLGMKQGHEMLIGLFDDTGAYPAFRASSMLGVYFVQALSIWLLPKAIFCPRRSVSEIAELRPLTTRNLYLGTLVSVLPMILYGAVMITVQYMRNRNIWLVLLSLVITAASAWATHWVIKKGAFKIKILLLAALANLALVFLLVLFGKGLQKQNLYWNYACVGVCMVIQVPILAGLFTRLLLPDNG